MVVLDEELLMVISALVVGCVRALGNATELRALRSAAKSSGGWLMEGRIVTEQRHGRYFAQELMLDKIVHFREQIQDALDAGESQEWHLVGVSDVLPERGVILFWGTAKPSFGRSSRR
jgi:hypothetical protein